MPTVNRPKRWVRIFPLGLAAALLLLILVARPGVVRAEGVLGYKVLATASTAYTVIEVTGYQNFPISQVYQTSSYSFDTYRIPTSVNFKFGFALLPYLEATQDPISFVELGGKLSLGWVIHAPDLYSFTSLYAKAGAAQVNASTFSHSTSGSEYSGSTYLGQFTQTDSFSFPSQTVTPVTWGLEYGAGGKHFGIRFAYVEKRLPVTFQRDSVFTGTNPSASSSQGQGLVLTQYEFSLLYRF